jgi:hypothetical protein
MVGREVVGDQVGVLGAGARVGAVGLSEGKVEGSAEGERVG